MPQLATFTLAGHLFGVEVTRVQEVLRYQPSTRVPLAPPAIAGLVNLRGHVVATVDLRRRLSLPARAEGAEPMNVVVRVDGEAIGLLVDAVCDVVTVRQDAFEPAPPTLSRAERALIRGAYALPDRLLLALDVARAVDVA